ncbi:hypothetical protein [Streptomyces sp. NPDC060035]|uniref:hypothetical protein n=1 Tax=Streptomyces sp. NPDC060035 TaxID=3347044 RepID=UPI0036A788A0
MRLAHLPMARLDAGQDGELVVSETTGDSLVSGPLGQAGPDHGEPGGGTTGCRCGW